MEFIENALMAMAKNRFWLNSVLCALSLLKKSREEVSNEKYLIAVK